MKKVTWISKNAQEVLSAANLLGHSISKYTGNHSLVVPSLEDHPDSGIVTYHTLIDNNPIKYKSTEFSDFTFVFDAALLINISHPISETSILVINHATTGYQFGKHRRTFSINASAIAESVAGSSSIAAAFIGTFVALSGILSYEAAVNSIKDLYGKKAEKQIALFAVTYGIVLEGASL